MAWDFTQILAYARQFGGRPIGTELAFVLSEWTAGDGLLLWQDYLVSREDMPPDAEVPDSQARRAWVKVNDGAWQQLYTLAQVTAIGIGSVGVVTSGVEASMVIAPWSAKSIAAGYIVAASATLDAINSDRATGVALIRVRVNSDESDHPLSPDEPFAAQQVTALNTWLSDHNITAQEFAALFDVQAAQLADWLQTHQRWEFAQRVHDRFGG